MKQSAYILALFLGTASAYNTPESVSLFATGMNGDEDLNEDIIMKGDKFHYVQNQGKEVPSDLSEPEKVHTLDPKINKEHTTFYNKNSLIQLNTEPEKVQILEPIAYNVDSNGPRAFPNQRTAFYAQKPAADLSEPEKVHILDPKIAREHTSFYNKQYLQTDPEKLQILEPIAYNVDSNGPRAFPNQRTAFYAQKPAADLSEPEKVHTLDPKIAREHTSFYAQAAPDLSEPEKVHILDPKIAREHTSFYDKKNGMWRNQLSQVDPIGSANYDAWVYEFSKESMGPYAQHAKKQASDVANSHIGEPVWEFSNDNVDSLQNPRTNKAPAHGSFAQRGKQDIAEPNMEENVHAFANDNVDALPYIRKENQYAPNGSGPLAHKNSFGQRGKQDIAEPNMEENVHAFANDNVDVLPYIRKENQYAPNGSGPLAHKDAFAQKNKRDIAEPNMEEDVHGLANDNVDVLPHVRKESQYEYNGQGPLAHKDAFAQKNKKDIAEPNMEEDVHGLANDNVDVLPHVRKESQYDYNGKGPLAHKDAFAQKNKKDIAEPNMEEDVHGLANDNVDVLPHVRRESQYEYNGQGPNAHKQSFMQKSAVDVNNSEIRPDVWEIVDKAVNPTPLWRSDEAPENRHNGDFKYTGKTAYNNAQANANKQAFFDKQNQLWRQ